MKKNTNTLDITQPVEFIADIPEVGSLTITGSYEDVAPIYEDYVRSAPKPEKVQRVVKSAGSVALEAIQPIVTGLFGNVAIDARAKLYDIGNGTHFYQAVREQRQIRKDLRMAQGLGLLTLDVCAKHRKAMADVQKIR